MTDKFGAAVVRWRALKTGVLFALELGEPTVPSGIRRMFFDFFRFSLKKHKQLPFLLLFFPLDNQTIFPV